MNLTAQFSVLVFLLEVPPLNISRANADDEKSPCIAQSGSVTRSKQCIDTQSIISNSHFSLFAQKQQYLNKNILNKQDESAGIELLIRIPDPKLDGAYLDTETFIKDTTKKGQLGVLTTKIIEKIIRNATLLDKANAPYYINVPPPLISPIFAKELAAKLSKADLPNNLIGIELTEREVIFDRVIFDAGMAELKRIGIPLALDDYGQGQATRTFLVNLPVERVKIDRKIIRDAQQSLRLKKQLCLDINYMHTSNMEVIAEGIETIDDCNFATNVGCDGVQGYFFDRPKMLIPVDA